jgi:hypothetical protein
MAEIVDVLKSPFGLSGGRILSGSVTLGTDAFWYTCISSSTAIITFSNLGVNTAAATTGSISASFSAGQNIYGNITSVTQSTGLAIIYSGSYISNIRY